MLRSLSRSDSAVPELTAELTVDDPGVSDEEDGVNASTDTGGVWLYTH
jgi:hypothetical protein